MSSAANLHAQNQRYNSLAIIIFLLALANPLLASETLHGMQCFSSHLCVADTSAGELASERIIMRVQATRAVARNEKLGLRATRSSADLRTKLVLSQSNLPVRRRAHSNCVCARAQTHH